MWCFEPWMLAMMDQAGHNGIRKEHIDAIAEEILQMGIAEVSRTDFEHVCRNCNIDPDNFTQADLNRLEEKLNE